MLATLIAGLYANPASGSLASMSWARQQIINDEYQNLRNALSSLGITVLDT